MRRIYVLKGMIMKLCYIYSSFNRVNLAVGLIAGSLSVAAGNAVALNYSYPIPYQVVSDNGLCLADSGDRLNLKLEQCSAAARPQKFFASDAAGAMVYDFEQILSSGATADILMVAINDLTGGGHVAPQFRLIAWQSPPGVAPGVGLMTAGAIGAVTKISGGVIDMGADIAMIASEGRPFSSSTSREVLYGAMQLYGAQGVFNSRRVGPGDNTCDNYTFGDPIVGTNKNCFVWNESNESDWSTIYPEGGYFRLYGTGSRIIRYGAWGNYNYRSLPTGSLNQCNSDTFDGDPIVGTVKTCQMFFPSMRVTIQGVPFSAPRNMCMTRNDDSTDSHAVISGICDASNARQVWRLRPAFSNS